jgi:hypothetical protein
MSIKTNHSEEALIPGSGVLTVDSSGALGLPVGADADRPTAPLAGHVRFSSTGLTPEVFNGLLWDALVATSYVDAADANLQSQIDDIVSNLDPAALDSLAEIVAAFQSEDQNLLAITAQNAADILNLQTGLQTEINNRTAGQSFLNAALNTEKTTRANADTTLQTNITNETTARQTADNNLQTDINNEIANRQTAINTVTFNLNSEITNRTNADNALQAEIGTLSNLTTVAKTSLVNAINELNADAGTLETTLLAAIQAEETRALNAEAGLATDIQNEETRALNAEAVLAQDIVNETNRAQTAEQALSTDIANEATLRQAADQILANDLTTEINNRIAGDTLLQNNIDAEELARIAGDNALQSNIDALVLQDLVDTAVATPTEGQSLTWNSVTTKWEPATNALTPITRTFVGDGQTLDFDIVTSVPSANNLVVSVNGVTQHPSVSYTLTGTHTVTFDEIPETGDLIEVRILKGQTTTDRPRPEITAVSYSGQSPFLSIVTITVSNVTQGFGAKVNGETVPQISYISANQMQLMMEHDIFNSTTAGTGQCDLTLIDTTGNEYDFPGLLRKGPNSPFWTDDAQYIGSFSGGDAINYAVGVNSTSTLTLAATSQFESAPTWLSVSGLNLVGFAPNVSVPTRYTFNVVATIGSVDITRTYWIVVI